MPLLRLLECSLDAIEADGDERKEAERLPSEVSVETTDRANHDELT